MYLSASEAAVSTMGCYNKCSTFTFLTTMDVKKSVLLWRLGRAPSGYASDTPYKPTHAFKSTDINAELGEES